MNTIARTALRLSLAGAGVAVLGAGFVGQASAAEDDAPAQPADDQQVHFLPELPGGGALTPVQEQPSPQDLFYSDSLVSFLTPDGPEAQAPSSGTASS